MGWTRQRYGVILEKIREIGHNDNPLIIDCAIGNGSGSKFLTENGFKIKGYDISSERIEKCKTK